MTKLKCYEVRDDYYGYSSVLFSESSSKARYMAFQEMENVYHGFLEFCKATSVSRVPALDASYRGHAFMDWSDEDDRLDLVRELDWACSDEYDLECDSCVAKKYCLRYEEYLEMQEENT